MIKHGEHWNLVQKTNVRQSSQLAFWFASTAPRVPPSSLVTKLNKDRFDSIVYLGINCNRYGDNRQNTEWRPDQEM